MLTSVVLALPLLDQVRAEEFADPAFRQVWERSDKAVAEGRAVRTWLWGPQPNATQRESYADGPGGVRLVQYFDKSRMEITNSASDKASRWYVTNGLLTVELVKGRAQVGDNAFQPRSASSVPVGGDPNNPGPTYASFARLIESRAEARSGPVAESVNRAGQVGREVSVEAAKLATYTHYEAATGHNVPDVFWNWMQKLDEQWLFAMGYPISEPYWAKFIVAGSERELLVQLFERRVLTYNPANAPEWQIEMGNIGQHYYAWRYPASPPATVTPTPPGVSPTPIPSPGPNPTPTPDPVPATLNEEEKKFGELINQYRSQNNLPTLRVDSKLQQAARWQSEDMAKYNYFGHLDSQGRDYPKRLTDFGYTDLPTNENIAAGVQAQAAFELWKSSSGYNAIMLNPNYKAIGIGYVTNSKSTYQYYWTTTFGGK